ncbi:MAG: glycosyltransferase, partial [Lachnospiraceae bacterium]|nr:glycosyltransferase [Lachnospiraceae bacterium]
IVETINVEKVPGLRVLAVIKYGGVAYLGPRQIIWESALDYIARHPIIGSGVIQDRLEIVKSPAVIDYFGSHLDDPSKWMGLYSHNLFLEFLMQYGWILGGIICIIVILSALGLLLDCDSEKRMVSIAVIAQTFGILLFSKSAFSYAWLWVMLGLGFPFAVAKDRASKGAVSIWNAWCYIIKRWMAVVGGALVIAVVAGFLLYLKNANPATSAGRSFLWIVVISSGFGVVASCALGLFFCILEKNRTGSRDVTIGDGVPDAEEVNAEDALISIIIPHYNVPDRLEKLLDTIPDSKDLEVIVVDDGSDQEIERFHQLKEKNAGRNVSFIDEEQNGGAGRARNIGLIKAKGEYLLFADSDDFFVENAFDRIRKAIEDHGDCDILFFPPASMKDDGSQGDRCAIYEDLVNNYLSDPSPANEARMRFLFCSPCSKLVRRRIVTDNRISYDETRFGNDMMFGVKVAFYSEKVSGVGEAIYCALEREGSLTRDFNERPLMIRRKVRMRWLAFLCKYLSFKEMHLLGYSVFVYPRLVTEFIKIKSYEIRKGKL